MPPRNSRRAKRNAISGDGREGEELPASDAHAGTARRPALDPSGAQSHDTVAARRERRIVRDEDEGRGALAMTLEQRSMICVPGILVEIAGRLVGDEDGRTGRQRARQRHALLLAAGQLRRIMRKPLAEADRLEFTPGALEGIRHPRQFKRHRDILDRRHGRDEVERLEHDPHIAAAEAGKRVFIESGAGLRPRRRWSRCRSVRARP